ncbi:cyclic pyranopterin monophosphate synthase MoaC [Natronospira bacteriovora]|uniref:Cyclic pyranopterin monophosphate synthase MoaC n=1 Tax=Natronospira bacteriovora TaxID=3069753 RepID=A0ABU0W6P3_9GAMM|nr:cyclic pyranopterin monophosphate synthase MoaC [Natronospira sp. AB-CW4]MDQ2068670.1 cyclic pyranopterin monophosphate synthase MoaC [Natronospira sp. AB-CW4]
MTEPNYRMVDVGEKPVTRRRAIATGRIVVGPEVMAHLREGELPKGDPLRLAEVAAILAAKRTPDLLPLCHPLMLDHVGLICRLNEAEQAVDVFATVVTSARTGVEMEALAAVNAALLTIWDLSKPIEAALEIGGVKLLLKEGGKSGRWEHPDGLAGLPAELAA